MAEAQNMTISWRGDLLHCFLTADWLTTDTDPGNWDPNDLVSNFNRSELLAILEDHIETVIGRYKGRLDYITVANEINLWGEASSFWYSTIGPEYVAYAFNKTNEVDPDAKLCINEVFFYYDEVKLDEFCNYVENLLNQSIPVHAIGLEVYGWGNDEWGLDWNLFEQYLQRIFDLGLEVHFSEIADPIANEDGLGLDPERLQLQAEFYQRLIDIAIREENITVFSTGLTDKYSPWWHPYPSGIAPHIFDGNFEPKPAYYALQHRFQGNTSLYIHNFSDPTVNPDSTPAPWPTFGMENQIKEYYEVLTANFNNSNSWQLTDGSSIYRELNSGDQFVVNITSIPVFESDFNPFLNSFEIWISGDGFYGSYRGDYNYFWAFPEFTPDVVPIYFEEIITEDTVFDGYLNYFYGNSEIIQGVPIPGPFWIRDICPEGARWSWDDVAVMYQGHGFYMFNDTEIVIINNETTFGYSASNENYTRQEEWNKSTGLLAYYHYNGTVSSNITLDFEIILTNYSNPIGIPTWNQNPTNQFHEYGTIFNYVISASDYSGIDHYWINDTVNFGINGNGLISSNYILPIGEYWIEVRAYDPYDKNCTATIQITVDDTRGPTWDEVSSNQIIFYKQDFYYDVDASDPSGIDHYEINDTVNFAIDANGVIINTYSLPIGDYWIEIRAYDPYENYCYEIIKITVKKPSPTTPGIYGYEIGIFIVLFGFSIISILSYINKKENINIKSI